MHTFIFNEMSRLQYNISIGCSTKMAEIQRNYWEVTDVYFRRYGNEEALYWMQRLELDDKSLVNN